MKLCISELDCNRFGLNIGRVEDLTDPSLVSKVREFIDSNCLDCMIARCSSREVAVIYELEKAGFRLMEGRIRYVYQRVNLMPDFPVNQLKKNVKIRASAEGDNLEPLVRNAFFGYQGHYHHNPNLKPDECNNVYVDWALHTLSDKSGLSYLSVAEKAGNLIGFATGKRTNDGSFISGLLGIDPEERNQGLATALHYHRLQWCKEKDVQSVIVATSLNNWIYQNLLIKLGYKILDSDLTLHWMIGEN